ncbi:hypothetical protein KZZ52_33545 [Dactylosporangium sp. AC04546]|uniref:hypothetical protein n=1 Tax=Dactylosporangium sp. AC04546 TaxID=2862460 RepID=UPI001EDE6D73|nr:hypothetical protein [Dactylosporangium sp. AC04546]WVK78902.1 hypothetical protein KZZ52_33545 [Dactylosporangium sp. AC04546]
MRAAEPVDQEIQMPRTPSIDGAAPSHPERPVRHGELVRSRTWTNVKIDQLDITRRSARFHQENPHVYKILVGLAREWIHRTGRKRCSIAMLFERARWEPSIPTETTLVLDNNLRAFYSRLMMQNEPDLKGLFETRRRAGEQAPHGRRGTNCADQRGTKPDRLDQPTSQPRVPDRPAGRTDQRRPKDNRP